MSVNLKVKSLADLTPDRRHSDSGTQNYWNYVKHWLR
jgi:hypothetical protein